MLKGNCNAVKVKERKLLTLMERVSRGFREDMGFEPWFSLTANYANTGQRDGAIGMKVWRQTSILC